jgi:hypothetical protein
VAVSDCVETNTGTRRHLLAVATGTSFKIQTGIGTTTGVASPKTHYHSS